VNEWDARSGIINDHRSSSSGNAIDVSGRHNGCVNDYRRLLRLCRGCVQLVRLARRQARQCRQQIRIHDWLALLGLLPTGRRTAWRRDEKLFRGLWRLKVLVGNRSHWLRKVTVDL